MATERPHQLSVGGLAINWAVKSFVIVVILVIALALQEQFKISFSKGLILTGVLAVILHGVVIYCYSRSNQWQTAFITGDRGAVKALEYTVSIVCWVLHFLLWWYGALDATALFLFVPTYFATSLIAFHVSFAYFARREIQKKVLLLLVGNIWTLSHYIVIILRIREKIETP